MLVFDIGMLVFDIGILVFDIGMLVFDIGILVFDIGVLVFDIGMLVFDIGILVFDIGVLVFDIGMLVFDIGMLVFAIGMLVFDIGMLVFDIGMLVFDIGMLVFAIGMLVFDIGMLVFAIGMLVFAIGMLVFAIGIHADDVRRDVTTSNSKAAMAARSCVWWLLASARLVRTLAELPPCGPVDCAELMCWGVTRPAIQQVFAPVPLWLTCDFTTNGGGWTILQQRRDTDIDFYRTSRTTTLRVEVEIGRHTQKKHINYEHFYVDSEAEQFRLQLGPPVHGHRLPDELRNHTGPFCTKDSPDSTFCRREAVHFHTGWWFSRKRTRVGTDLNAKMLSRIRQERVYWRGVADIKTTAVKFRPAMFRLGKQTSCAQTCPNGGTCRRNTYGRYECDCAPGYTGRQCLTPTSGEVVGLRADIILTWMLLVFLILALLGMVLTPLHAWLIYGQARNSRLVKEEMDNERRRLVH
ncbi:hypothetical protein LSAT2_028250 [Lamellibrachia satsuma]|nr:hypothetical protein LSAT2_028250 [Lamellibrachia satsuma]